VAALNAPLRVLLVAAEGAGTHALRAVARAGCVVVGVLTGEGDEDDRARGNGVRALAGDLRCPIWPAATVRDAEFAEYVRRERVDVLLNIHSLYLIRAEILEAPVIGSFNLHPGPLPELAGLNAVSWALYEGRARHAVTLHWMVPKVDAGAIAYQAPFAIEAQDTALTLSTKCVRAGVPMITQLLAAAAGREIPAIPQDLTRRRYYGREVPEGGRLTWSRAAQEIVNFARACDYLPYRSPWGHPVGSFGGQQVALLKAASTGVRANGAPGTVGAFTAGGVLVSAVDEWVLVRRLIRDGQSLDARQVLLEGARFDQDGNGHP